MYYFDHASTGVPKPQPVIDAVVHAMQHTASSGRGAHDASLQASRVLLQTRSSLARLFGVSDPSRIAFTSNATTALNTAIKGLLNPGDHVITTQWEHNSVLRPLYEMGSLGVGMAIVPSDANGCLDGVGICDGLDAVVPLDADTDAAAGEGMVQGAAQRRASAPVADWAKYLRRNTKAVICNHASNVTGNVLDLQAVSKFCQERDLLLIVDAAQTAGVFPIDVEALGIDVLCFTGHKSLMGPQGTGGIYVRKGLNCRPLQSGGSGIMTFNRLHPQMMPEALEAGTQNIHGLAGLNAAVTYLFEQGMANLRQREQALAWSFFEQVMSVPGVTVYGDFHSEQRAPIVAVNIRDEHSGVVADVLAQTYSIFTRAGGHCAPLMHEALGTRDRGVIRFSFSHLNHEEEIEHAVHAVSVLARDGLDS